MFHLFHLTFNFTVKELKTLPNNLNDKKVKSQWLEINQEVV